LLSAAISVYAQVPKIQITEPVVAEAQEAVKIAFKVSGASQKRIRVKVDAGVSAVTSDEIKFSSNGEHVISVNLFQGKNSITLIGFVNDEAVGNLVTPLVVKCSGRWCKKPFSMAPDAVASELGADQPVKEKVAQVEEDATEPVKVDSPQKEKKPKPPKKPEVTDELDESQNGGIHINTPKADRVYVNAKTVSLKLTVDRKSKSDAAKNLKKVFITVLNEIKPSTQAKEISYAEDDVEKPGEVAMPINIGPGSNEIIAFDPAHPDEERASVKIVCEGNCGADTEGATSAGIKVEKPPEGSPPVNAKSIDSYLKVTKTASDKIDNVQYEVFKEGQTVFTGPKVPVQYSGDDPATVRVPVKIATGQNIVRFFDADHPGNKDHQAFSEVKCEGDNCASDFLVAAFPSNTQNSRAVVGFEQAGASSKDSEFKPFFDFFFTAPLLYRCVKPGVKSGPCEKEDLPRLAAWGQIRLASTPDQIAAASVFPTSLVNQVGRSTSSIDLVQSFDFLAGLEGRLKSANGNFLSLIPGIRQRTHFYLAGGGGAINPLNARKETAQIFTIPAINSPQRDDFIARYGTPPTTTPAKEFVGLVPLDRDRFLRQWYAGIRLKTFYCDNQECTKFKNNFPAIFDFMFGQNEAVTGGRFKYSLPDPTDSTKSIRKNSYVLRFDAFYPFPIREANFLYFYGSALMKIGAGGVRIQNPIFLENPGSEIKITDPRVYIPPANLQERFQPNRDYYKIGIGVNLTELFNRNKTQ
jgi:hypothetical protein